MKTIVMFRDYSDNPFTRDIVVFKPDDDLNRTFWVFRTVFGAIAYGSKGKNPLTKDLYLSIKNFKNSGFTLINDHRLVGIMEENFKI